MLHSTLLINKYTGKNKKQFLFYECNLNKMIFKSASAVNYESKCIEIDWSKGVGILFIRSQHYCKLSNLTDKKKSAELDL